MVERVAVPLTLLENALAGSETSARLLQRATYIPVSGPVCPDCGQTQCSEYREGDGCPAPFCDGSLVNIGERKDPRDER